MSEEPKPRTVAEAIRKGHNSPPPKNPRVFAAGAFILFLSMALIVEYSLQLGREFLIVITLWIVLMVASKFHNRFPDKDK